MHSPAGRSLQTTAFQMCDRTAQRQHKGAQGLPGLPQTPRARGLAPLLHRFLRCWGLSMAVKWLRTSEKWRVCLSLTKFCLWNTDTFPTVRLYSAMAVAWFGRIWTGALPPSALHYLCSNQVESGTWTRLWAPLPPGPHSEPWVKQALLRPPS